MSADGAKRPGRSVGSSREREDGRSRPLRGLRVWLAGALVALGAVAALAVDDPLLENQWHLKPRSQEPAGANVRAAWPTTRGAGVVIGIVDDGLQHTHPDLQPNYSAALSHDFNFGDADPYPDTAGSCNTTADCHGTAVAGVAAARGDNGIGVSGAAPLAGLAGLRLIAAPITDAQMAAAVGHELDAIHIESNSWGPGDDGQTMLGPGPLMRAALQNAVTTGRGGKGRIFLWAAGNGLQNQDNCNFDGFANNHYVMAIGALTDGAAQPFYGEPCAAMFASAPSNGGSRGITTTDLLGGAGYDGSSDYTSAFGGTSSATPLVSGVVALMLAQNPNLSWRDVKEILARTAVKVNAGDAGWTTGSYAHNEKYGFGLVDGQAAVSLATGWTNLPAESAVPAVTRTLSLPIPDNSAAGVTDSIVVGPAYSGFVVEYVEVEFDATHPYRGDLEVTLTSPSGVVSRLATVRPSDSGDNFSAWRFGTVRHWGSTAAGTWTLKVADVAAADIGVWNYWTLRIFGRTGTSFTISGQVTGDAGGLAGVTMPLSGAAAATTTTDSGGNYSFGGLANGGYTVTPSKTSCTFTPSSRPVTVAGADVTGQSFAATCTPSEIILDNLPAGTQDAARTFTGTWCVSGGSSRFGADSLYSCGAGMDTYRWTPTIPAAGTYDVYVWWSYHPMRSTSVPITVTHAAGSTTLNFNEQNPGGMWVLHGRYSFNAGTGGSVQVSDINGQAAADAVRFVPVTVTPNPVPALTSLSPPGATAGGPAFTLTVNGSGFVAGSVVRWNGAGRPTTFVSAAQVTAAISAADIAAPGTPTVTVFNPAPGGGLSNSLTFTINPPPPTVTITASTPTATEAGASPGAFTVSRTGSTTAALTVSYTVSGTATAGSDYVTLPGSVTIPSGSLSAPIPVTPIDDPAVEPNETVIVTLSASAAYTVGSPAAATVTIVSNDVAATEIILDNLPAGTQDAARTFTGTWCVSGGSSRFGVDSLYSCGAGVDTYRWTPTIPAAGTYDVYVWWSYHPMRSTNVPITVTHAAGSTMLTFNEQLPGGMWVLHGRYGFNGGTAGFVQVSDVNGQAAADAVRFVPVP